MDFKLVNHINRGLNFPTILHIISDESKFGDANENEMNESPNATLRDFNDYLMDDIGHMAAKNNDKCCL